MRLTEKQAAELGIQVPPRKNKYRNQPVTIEEETGVPGLVQVIRFASKAEARYYGELKLLERAGKIEQLKLQPRYIVAQSKTNPKLKVEFRGDFEFLETDTLKWVCIDVKGVETEAFKIKAKLFRIAHPEIELRIVGRRR